MRPGKLGLRVPASRRLFQLALGGWASVTVMQSAQPRPGDNIANMALVGRFDRAAERAILVERSVAAIVVIIGQVFREHLAEMLRITGATPSTQATAVSFTPWPATRSGQLSIL